MKAAFKILVFASLLFCSIKSNAAEDYDIRPVDTYFTEYQNKHRIIIDFVENQTNLTLAQRLALYETELNKLKNEFKALRKAEYEAILVARSVGNSCTSGSSGGVKNCGWKCVDAPSPHLYTTESNISVIGTNKGTSVNSGGASACLKMTVAGRGRNAGTLTAQFKYRPESVLSLVERDLTDLFVRVCAVS